MEMPRKNKKPTISAERVTVCESVALKLESLHRAANELLMGIVTVTKSDVANLILGEHSGNLNAQEVEKLKSTHFDEVKYVSWMTRRLKDARAAGENVTLADLVKMAAQPQKKRSHVLSRDGPKKPPSADITENPAIDGTT